MNREQGLQQALFFAIIGLGLLPEILCAKDWKTMREKVSIILDKEWLGLLTPEQERRFVFGCVFYEQFTNEGEHPITAEKAAEMSDEAINLTMSAIFLSDIDVEHDRVAFDTLECLWDELEKRHPTPKEEIEESLRRFKEKHREFFPEV